MASNVTTKRLSRLRALLWTVILLPMLLFSLGAWFEHEELLDWAESDATDAVRLLSGHLLATIEAQQILLQQLDVRTRGMTTDEIQSKAPSIVADMAAMQTGLPQTSMLTVTDARGVIAVSTDPRGRDEHLPIADEDVRWTRGNNERSTVFSRPDTVHGGDRLTFGISRKRTATGPEFAGTVSANVPVSSIEAFWASVLQDRPGGTIALFSRDDGKVLARSPRGQAMSPAQGDLDNPTAVPRTTIGTYRAISSADRVERIYAYAAIGNYPLLITYGFALSDVLAEWLRNVAILGSLCGLAALLLGAAVIFAIRQAVQLIEEQTRRREIEEAVQTSQRLEIMGQLTASVAHDFANVIQVVQAGVLLIERKAHDPQIRQMARMIGEASDQGATLTRRMLDFARTKPDGEAVEHALVPIETLTRVCGLLEHLLGRSHPVQCEFADGSWLQEPVRGDSVGLEGAIMNLAINARDAMPKGGAVIVSAQPYRITGSGEVGSSRPAMLRPGYYTCIGVADTGSGMTADVLARASEPFFTTKPFGKGTGLGLAGVRVFAERAGGGLSIDTVVGKGSKVSLWLPIAAPTPGEDYRSLATTGYADNLITLRVGNSQ